MTAWRRTMSRITLCATAVIAAGAWGGCGVESGDGDEAFAQADALTTTMSFQDGVAPSTSYAGTTDAVLQQASPTTNVGSDTTMRVDMDYPSGTGKAATAVLRFDLSAIPKASTIKSASLTINVTNATGGEGYTLYALNRAWDEPVVTWNTARAGSAWSPGGARGADHGSTPLGVLLPTTVGKYTLSLNADGVRVVQGWVASPSTNHGFVLEAPTNMDGLEFDSSEVSTAANRPRFSVGYDTPAPVGTGLLAQYYTGKSFEALATTRTDSTVNFDWGSAAPSGTSVGTDNFSVRWSGQVLPAHSQTYTFYTRSDDGVRLWVNGQKVIDNWTNHAAVENLGTIALTAGQKYAIKLEYYEATGGAVVQLSWSSPSQPKQIVPAASLFPDSVPVADAGAPSTDSGAPGTDSGAGSSGRGPISFPTLAAARAALKAPADASYVMWNPSWPANRDLEDVFATELGPNDILVLPERAAPYIVDSSEGFRAAGVQSVQGRNGQVPIVSRYKGIRNARTWFAMARARRGILGLGPNARIEMSASSWTRERQIEDKGSVQADGWVSPGRTWINTSGQTMGELIGAQEKVFEAEHTAPYFGNFTMRTRDLGGVAYSGLSSSGTVQTYERLDLTAGWRGFQGVPNGETGAISSNKGSYLISKCILGTRDISGKRVGSSPIMINSSPGGRIEDTDASETYAGMLTIWNSGGKHVLSNVNTRFNQGPGLNIEKTQAGFELEWIGGSNWSDYKGNGGKSPKPADQGTGGSLHVGLFAEGGSAKLKFVGVDFDNGPTPGAVNIQSYGATKQRLVDIVRTDAAGNPLPVKVYGTVY